MLESRIKAEGRKVKGDWMISRIRREKSEVVTLCRLKNNPGSRNRSFVCVYVCVETGLLF